VPGHDPIPLFDAPTDFEEDETGYLGVDPINLDDPPQLKVPQTSRPTVSDADIFDDDNGALGVFDGVLPDPES
jgi:hypothetical protein